MPVITEFFTTDELRLELDGAKASYKLLQAHRNSWPKYRRVFGERNLKRLRTRIDSLAGELAMATTK